MITSAEFYAQMQIWGLREGGNPPPPPPPGGVYTPVLGAFSGLDDVEDFAGSYSANTNASGGIVTVAVSATVTPDSSGDLCTLLFNAPITTTFAATSNAIILGQPLIIPVSGAGFVGNVGAGWGNQLYAQPTSSAIFFSFETAVPSVPHYLQFSFQYEIQ